MKVRSATNQLIPVTSLVSRGFREAREFCKRKANYGRTVTDNMKPSEIFPVTIKERRDFKVLISSMN